MAKEIRAAAPTGRVVYAHVLDSTGKRWNGTAFETYASGNYSTYVIALTEQGASGVYLGDFPAAITSGGAYDFFAYLRVGGSNVEGDPVVGEGNINWSGTAVNGTVSTVDTTIALISLDDAKAFLKITTSTENEYLSALINGISSACEGFCGRKFLQRTYTEYYNGSSRGELVLKNTPIVSLTSLYVSDANRVFDSTSLVDPTTYIVKSDVGAIQFANAYYGVGSYFFAGVANIKVIYSAGYALASVPYDLKLAVKKWVAQQYMKGISKRHDIQGESVGDKNTTFINEEVPKEVESLLRKYKDRVSCPDYAYS